MKFFINVIMAMSLLLVSNIASAKEVSYEVIPSFYSLGKSLNGSVHLKICDSCPLLKLRITPATKALVDYKEVDLASKVGAKKPMFVSYDTKTKKVVRMFWYGQ